MAPTTPRSAVASVAAPNTSSGSSNWRGTSWPGDPPIPVGHQDRPVGSLLLSVLARCRRLTSGLPTSRRSRSERVGSCRWAGTRAWVAPNPGGASAKRTARESCSVLRPNSDIAAHTARRHSRGRGHGWRPSSGQPSPEAPVRAVREQRGAAGSRSILIPAWRAVSTVRSVKAMDEITAGDVCTACGATVRATEVSERDAQGGVSMARVWSCGCDGVEGPQVADD